MGLTSHDGNFHHLTSTSGLDNYPQQGQNFSMNFYWDSSGGTGNTGRDVSMAFGDNNSNKISIFKTGDVGGDWVRLRSIEDGETTEKVTKSVDWSAEMDQTLTIQGNWSNDGEFTYTVKRPDGSTVVSMSVTDDQVGESGGYLQIVGKNGPTYFDDIKING